MFCYMETIENKKKMWIIKWVQFVSGVVVIFLLINISTILYRHCQDSGICWATKINKTIEQSPFAADRSLFILHEFRIIG